MILEPGKLYRASKQLQVWDKDGYKPIIKDLRVGNIFILVEAIVKKDTHSDYEINVLTILTLEGVIGRLCFFVPSNFIKEL